MDYTYSQKNSAEKNSTIFNIHKTVILSLVIVLTNTHELQHKLKQVDKIQIHT